MKHLYTPFLAIFLIFVIIGFSLYKQLDDKKEGLENMDIDPSSESKPIITRNNHKVRRRKTSITVDKKISRVYRENFNIKDIGRGFKKMGDALKKIPQFFRAIGSYLKCGVARIKSMPSCMPWYLLEIFGQIIYLPFRILFWMTRTKEIEKLLWKKMEELDKMIHNISGLHIIHYPDFIQDSCYRCKGMVPFPK